MLCLASMAASNPARTADWPQFLGPDRNGSTPETLALPWPTEGPRTVWSRPVGTGFAGPVVAGRRLLIHHRQDNLEILECLDADRGGDPLWRQTQSATYRDDFGFDNGPRATPAVAGDRVITAGAAGIVCCTDLQTGKTLWTVDTARAFGARKGFFGFAASPLVMEGRVLVVPGGQDNAGIVALDLADGHTLWKTTPHEAGYASPVPVVLAGKPQALFLTREGAVLLDPAHGRVLIQHPFRSRQQASVNAATPLVLDPPTRVFLTASYGTGAAVLDLDLAHPIPRTVWSGDDSLSSHYASAVHHQGTVFGFHGRQEQGPEFRAIAAATGKVLWTRTGLGAGTVTLAGNQLLVLTERGELISAPASPKHFQPSARAQILGSGTRAHPALAHGLLYARDPRRLVCVQVGPGRN
jgi:hypothetical protein